MYNQGTYWDGHRQDCSGYASMALGLAKPGKNTVGLGTDRSVTRPIGMGELRPGDLVIDHIGKSNTRHVVIFEKWDNDAHSSYTAYDQNGAHNTEHRSRTYGLNPGSEYKGLPPRPLRRLTARLLRW